LKGIESIYRKLPPEEIPWNNETPPAELVELVGSGKVKPCKSADMGCGMGNYTIYLAGRGFEMTGVDSSHTAIKLARENAKAHGASCSFQISDVLGRLNRVKGPFDFIYDWDLLHHIFPEKRLKYVENVYRLLRTGGKYFSVCFSEKDPQFGGSGKYRRTRIGTLLYFSSEDELKTLFDPYFKIIDLKTIKISGKSEPHLVNYVFMEKR